MKKAKYFRLLALAAAAYGLIAVKPMRAVAVPRPAEHGSATAVTADQEYYGGCAYDDNDFSHASVYSASAGYQPDGWSVLSGDVCGFEIDSQSVVSVLN